jgi:hypothetical protein
MLKFHEVVQELKKLLLQIEYLEIMISSQLTFCYQVTLAYWKATFLTVLACWPRLAAADQAALEK